jgi:hypothetical protein
MSKFAFDEVSGKNYTHYSTFTEDTVSSAASYLSQSSSIDQDVVRLSEKKCYNGKPFCVDVEKSKKRYHSRDDSVSCSEDRHQEKFRCGDYRDRKRVVRQIHEKYHGLRKRSNDTRKIHQISHHRSVSRSNSLKPLSKSRKLDRRVPSERYVRDIYYSDLPIEYWERSEPCKNAKEYHTKKLDRLWDSREDLVLQTTLWRKDTVLERNMFPCKFYSYYYC